MTQRNDPRLFRNLARWWHLFSDPDDYKEEARFWRRAFVEQSKTRPKTVLELGSGGGNSAYHLKRHFDMTLSDISQGMLDLSATVNPECEHIQGDMRTLRLGREYDVVFVHDAINYMIDVPDIMAVLETAYVHLKPGGVAFFGPDQTRSSFREDVNCAGHDGPDGRALRYMVWISDPDPTDTHFSLDFAYMLREPDGTVHVEQDRHLYALFSHREWMQFVRDAGFKTKSMRFDLGDEGTVVAFVGTKPER